MNFVRIVFVFAAFLLMLDADTIHNRENKAPYMIDTVKVGATPSSTVQYHLNGYDPENRHIYFQVVSQPGPGIYCKVENANVLECRVDDIHLSQNDTCDVRGSIRPYCKKYTGLLEIRDEGYTYEDKNGIERTLSPKSKIYPFEVIVANEEYSDNAANSGQFASNGSDTHAMQNKKLNERQFYGKFTQIQKGNRYGKAALSANPAKSMEDLLPESLKKQYRYAKSVDPEELTNEKVLNSSDALNAMGGAAGGVSNQMIYDLTDTILNNMGQNVVNELPIYCDIKRTGLQNQQYFMCTLDPFFGDAQKGNKYYVYEEDVVSALQACKSVCKQQFVCKDVSDNIYKAAYENRSVLDETTAFGVNAKFTEESSIKGFKVIARDGAGTELYTDEVAFSEPIEGSSIGWRDLDTSLLEDISQLSNGAMRFVMSVRGFGAPIENWEYESYATDTEVVIKPKRVFYVEYKVNGQWKKANYDGINLYSLYFKRYKPRYRCPLKNGPQIDYDDPQTCKEACVLSGDCEKFTETGVFGQEGIDNRCKEVHLQGGTLLSDAYEHGQCQLIDEFAVGDDNNPKKYFIKNGSVVNPLSPDPGLDFSEDPKFLQKENAVDMVGSFLDMWNAGESRETLAKIYPLSEHKMKSLKGGFINSNQEAIDILPIAKLTTIHYIPKIIVPQRQETILVEENATPHSGISITCSSWGYAYNECYPAFGNIHIHKVELLQEYDYCEEKAGCTRQCILNSTYGIDSNDRYMYVKNNCRGKFKIYTNNGNHEITCISNNNVPSKCSIAPDVEISKIDVNQIYSHGWANGYCGDISGQQIYRFKNYGILNNKKGIWVDNGCRASFTIDGKYCPVGYTYYSETSICKKFTEKRVRSCPEGFVLNDYGMCEKVNGDPVDISAYQVSLLINEPWEKFRNFKSNSSLMYGMVPIVVEVRKEDNVAGGVTVLNYRICNMRQKPGNNGVFMATSQVAHIAYIKRKDEKPFDIANVIIKLQDGKWYFNSRNSSTFKSRISRKCAEKLEFGGTLHLLPVNDNTGYELYIPVRDNQHANEAITALDVSQLQDRECKIEYIQSQTANTPFDVINYARYDYSTYSQPDLNALPRCSVRYTEIQHGNLDPNSLKIVPSTGRKITREFLKDTLIAKDMSLNAMPINESLAWAKTGGLIGPVYIDAFAYNFAPMSRLYVYIDTMQNLARMTQMELIDKLKYSYRNGKSKYFVWQFNDTTQALIDRGNGYFVGLRSYDFMRYLKQFGLSAKGIDYTKNYQVIEAMMPVEKKLDAYKNIVYDSERRINVRVPLQTGSDHLNSTGTQNRYPVDVIENASCDGCIKKAVVSLPSNDYIYSINNTRNGEIAAYNSNIEPFLFLKNEATLSSGGEQYNIFVLRNASGMRVRMSPLNGVAQEEAGHPQCPNNKPHYDAQTGLCYRILPKR